MNGNDDKSVDVVQTATPTRSLSILLVTARYVPEIGGTELHTRELAERLVARGHSVTVVTTDRTHGLPAREALGGVEIRRVRAWPSSRDYYFAPGLIRAMRDGQFQLVHLQGYHTLVAPIALATARRMRVPYIVAFHSGGHSSRVRRSMRRAQIRALRPLLGSADRLVANSVAEHQYFLQRLRFPEGKFAIIPIGANLPEITEGLPHADGTTLILSIGRLERYKGHHRIVDGLPALRKIVPNARLRIVGEGPQRAALQERARDLGVEDHLEIAPIGTNHRDELALLLNRASLVISLSEFESAGMSIREALALKRPVLVSEIDGFADIAGSPFVTRIPLSSSNERVAGQIAEALRSTFVDVTGHVPTWDECVDRFEEIYFEAILSAQ